MFCNIAAWHAGCTLGHGCHRQPLPVSTQVHALAACQHTACPSSAKPSANLICHARCIKVLRSSFQRSSICTWPHSLSNRTPKQCTVCWAGSADQHSMPADAAAPQPSNSKPMFSPLVPVFRQTKHDSDIRGLAIPALFSLLLDPIMSLVDCAIIGRLGSDSLAATGASISIFSLAGLLVSFLSYVTVPAVAEAVTSGDDAEVSKVISTGWLSSLQLLNKISAGLIGLKVAQFALRLCCSRACISGYATNST